MGPPHNLRFTPLIRIPATCPFFSFALCVAVCGQPFLPSRGSARIVFLKLPPISPCPPLFFFSFALLTPFLFDPLPAGLIKAPFLFAPLQALPSFSTSPFPYVLPSSTPVFFFFVTSSVAVPSTGRKVGGSVKK